VLASSFASRVLSINARDEWRKVRVHVRVRVRVRVRVFVCMCVYACACAGCVHMHVQCYTFDDVFFHLYSSLQLETKYSNPSPCSNIANVAPTHANTHLLQSVFNFHVDKCFQVLWIYEFFFRKFLKMYLWWIYFFAKNNWILCHFAGIVPHTRAGGTSTNSSRSCTCQICAAAYSWVISSHKTMRVLANTCSQCFHILHMFWISQFSWVAYPCVCLIRMHMWIYTRMCICISTYLFTCMSVNIHT